jgi:hypothetical protein
MSICCFLELTIFRVLNAGYKICIDMATLVYAMYSMLNTGCGNDMSSDLDSDRNRLWPDLYPHPIYPRFPALIGERSRGKLIANL